MRRTLLAMACAAGCYHGPEAGDSDSDDVGDSSGKLPIGTSGEVLTSEGTSESGVLEESTTEADASAEQPLATDEFDCVGVLVHEQTGTVFAVPAAGGGLEITPLQPGEGFTCMRVELELDVAPAPAHVERCPVYAAIASIRGSAIGGEDMAAAFLHGYELGADGCTRGEDRLVVANFRELSDDVLAPPMRGSWRVRLMVKPFVSRFEVLDDDGHAIASVSANLFPASIADTRDPIVKLGLDDAIGETLVPWGSVAFRELRIFAQVAAAE